MISSLQRITGALLGTALVALTIATTYQVAFLCTAGQTNCLAAAITFGVPDAEIPQPILGQTHESTVAVLDTDSDLTGFLFDLVQMLSIYIILISVLMIVVLELFELRYLKRLTQMQVKT